MIIVFGGTHETHEICDFLLENDFDFILCTATEYSMNSFSKYEKHLMIKKLDSDQMTDLIHEKNIKLLIDVTHPYAAEVSHNIMKAAEKTGAEYIRFQRRQLLDDDMPGVYRAESHQDAALLALKIGKRPFLAVGSNNAAVYIKYKEFEKIYIRVLPTSNVLKKCEDLGYGSGTIIAMQGPFSKELNKQLLIDCRCDIMITKDSGAAGGFLEKYEACRELDIPLIVVGRPEIEYKNNYDDIEDIKTLLAEYKR